MPAKLESGHLQDSAIRFFFFFFFFVFSGALTSTYCYFLPVFLSSDYFLDRAIAISVGSLSPTVNWRDLKVQEFDLPPLDEQKRIADLIWAVERHQVAQWRAACCGAGGSPAAAVRWRQLSGVRFGSAARRSSTVKPCRVLPCAASDAYPK